MSSDDKDEKPRTALIKEHLRRSFQDKADEALPTDLMSLIAKLKEQDGKDGK